MPSTGTHDYQAARQIIVTTTGNIDDLDPDGASLILMNNASLATIRGIKAGYAGKRITIVSIGAGQVNLAHQNVNSAAVNRFINFATSGITPLAAGSGSATYQYDNTTQRWRLVSHEQGAWIDVPYNAANFTSSSGVWTVQSADQTTFSYFLMGRVLCLTIVLGSTSITVAAPNNLSVTIPNGYTFSHINRGPIKALDNNVDTDGLYSMAVGGTQITFFLNALGTGTWSLSANLTNIYYAGFVMVN